MSELTRFQDFFMAKHNPEICVEAYADFLRLVNKMVADAIGEYVVAEFNKEKEE